MFKINDAAINTIITTIVTAVVLVIMRSLLGIPIGTNELLVVIVSVLVINFLTQLILKRDQKP